MTRQEVYQAIDRERDCQEKLKANLVSRKLRIVPKELSEHSSLLKIELMRGFADKARNTWWSQPPCSQLTRVELTRVILKMTALGVAFLEEHGITPKEIAKISRKKERRLALPTALRDVLKNKV